MAKCSTCLWTWSEPRITSLVRSRSGGSLTRGSPAWSRSLRNSLMKAWRSTYSVIKSARPVWAFWLDTGMWHCFDGFLCFGFFTYSVVDLELVGENHLWCPFSFYYLCCSGSWVCTPLWYSSLASSCVSFSAVFPTPSCLRNYPMWTASSSCAPTSSWSGKRGSWTWRRRCMPSWSSSTGLQRRWSSGPERRRSESEHSVDISPVEREAAQHPRSRFALFMRLCDGRWTIVWFKKKKKKTVFFSTIYILRKWTDLLVLYYPTTTSGKQVSFSLGGSF